jgi:glycosyltransferase involved in cell wall biosynthesis
MPGESPELSLIIPVFNEEPAVEELCGRLRAAVGRETEILFVDDGSTDGTRRTLSGLQDEDSLLRVIGFRRNYGKSIALAAAFRRARGRVLVTLDGDLQDDPGEIPRLVRMLEEEDLDLVGGWRRRRRDPPWKVLGSRIFNLIVSVAGGVRFRDINCGLKALRRRVIEEISLASGYHRFVPLLAHWKGFRVGETEVRHHPRRHGRSRYGRERVLRGLMDLAVILFLVRFEGRPGRYFAGLGALLSAAGLGVSAFIAYLRLSQGNIDSRYPLLSLGLVLMVVGLQLFSLGLFGELVAYHFRSRGTAFEPVVEESEGRGEKGEESEKTTGGG